MDLGLKDNVLFMILTPPIINLLDFDTIQTNTSLYCVYLICFASRGKAQAISIEE